MIHFAYYVIILVIFIKQSNIPSAIMSLIEGLIIFFSILLTYFFIVIYLNKKGILKKYNISLYGPAILLRTKRGRSFLKKIGERKRFWKAFGSSAIVFCFIMMFLMVIILAFQAWTVLGFTAEQKDALPGIEFGLILPGINPILPFDYIAYIILALIVAVVVHEFSHGILTFANKLKVKSLGILYLIIPLGAFCEPDEKQLQKTKTSNRMRVYAAGPTSNFVVVLLSIMLFSFLFMPSVQYAADGIIILSIGEDTPAEDLGLEPGMIITHINNTRINTFYDFFIVMNNTKSNIPINISYFGNEYYTKSVVLSDKYYEYEKRNPDANNKSFVGKGYLGVGPNPYIEFLPILKNPFNNFPNNFLLFYIIPLLGLDGYNPIYSPFTDSYIITGPLNFIPDNIFWIIVNSIYWIFWLNLAVGLFNVLPMIPLDGGFLFSDAIRTLIQRIKKNISDEKRDKIVRNVSLATSFLILIIVLFPWLVKYF